MFLANNAFVLRLPVLAVANLRPLISDSFFVVGESMASEGEMYVFDWASLTCVGIFSSVVFLGLLEVLDLEGEVVLGLSSARGVD